MPKRKQAKPRQRELRRYLGRAAKRLRAPRLPGLEDTAIEAIENAATDYEEHRDERLAASKPEVAAKQRLIGVMHAHGKKQYRRGDLVVELTSEKESVRVRRVKPGKPEPEDESAVA